MKILLIVLTFVMAGVAISRIKDGEHKDAMLCALSAMCLINAITEE